MSATALLHNKASQIGVTTTMNKTEPYPMSNTTSIPHYLMQNHVPAELYSNNNSHSSREEIGNSFSNCLASYGNKAAMNSADCCFEVSAGDQASSSLLHDVMGGGFVENTSFEGVNSMTMRGMFDTQQRDDANAANDEMTKDFLSLGGFSFNMSGIDPLDSLSFAKQNQNQEPWRG